MVQYWVQPRRSCWIQEALTRYPSTARSGKLSLLCETSLTHCPPRQEPLDPSLRPSPLVHLFAWKGQVSTRAPQNPTRWAGPMSHHFYAPTWVTSSHYKARRYVVFFCSIYTYKRSFVLSIWDQYLLVSTSLGVLRSS